MSDEDRGFAIARDEATDRVLRKLRRLVRQSARSQRSVEQENGFRRGYLSQVLKGHITLTVRHLLGILRALDVAPSRFFAEFEGRDRPREAPMLLEMRERMARYDAALEELTLKGILDPSETIPPRDEREPRS